MGDQAREAISQFRGREFEKHHPHHMWCGCIDGRERGGGNFEYADDTIRATEIAAAFPPYEIAPRTIRSKFSFRKIKDVRVIKLVGHSDCGGAQTALAYPDHNNAPDQEIADIVAGIAETGADLPRLRDAFILACEGDEWKAANLLSRHITLVSLDNISRYPHINEGVMNNTLDLIPLYHDLKRGSGETSILERYDVDKKIWVPTAGVKISNMCERPHNCTACESCHATIADSLKWEFVQASTAEGQTTMIEVPHHVAKLLERDMDVYQPRLHREQSSKVVVRPVVFLRNEMMASAPALAAE